MMNYFVMSGFADHLDIDKNFSLRKNKVAVE